MPFGQSTIDPMDGLRRLVGGFADRQFRNQLAIAKQEKEQNELAEANAAINDYYERLKSVKTPAEANALALKTSGSLIKSEHGRTLAPLVLKGLDGLFTETEDDNLTPIKDPLDGTRVIGYQRNKVRIAPDGSRQVVGVGSTHYETDRPEAKPSPILLAEEPLQDGTSKLTYGYNIPGQEKPVITNIKIIGQRNKQPGTSNESIKVEPISEAQATVIKYKNGSPVDLKVITTDDPVQKRREEDKRINTKRLTDLHSKLLDELKKADSGEQELNVETQRWETKSKESIPAILNRLRTVSSELGWDTKWIDKKEIDLGIKKDPKQRRNLNEIL